MAAPTHADDARPIVDPAELVGIFQEAEKPPSRFLIGAEAEKFGVVERTGAPMDYAPTSTRSNGSSTATLRSSGPCRGRSVSFG